MASDALEKRLTKWRADLDVIADETLTMHLERRIWSELWPTLVAASTDDATLLEHYGRIYWQSQVMVIRRLVYGGADSLTLPGLLREVLGSGLITRDIFVGLVAGGDEEWIQQKERDQFDEAWADDAGAISKAKVDDFIEGLR